MGAYPLFFRIHQGSSIQMLQSISVFLESDPLIVDAFHESHGSCSRSLASAWTSESEPTFIAATKSIEGWVGGVI
jgi:hypothetical protein